MRSTFWILLLFGLGSGLGLSFQRPVAVQSKWKAPAWADTLKNPYANRVEEALKMGERIYQQQCAVCHGPRGRGDGPAGMALNPRPADLTSKAVQAQTDGALFWKISEGRGAMPAFKGMLSEAERWQVVTYVRTLARK